MPEETLLDFVIRFQHAATNRQEKFVVGEITSMEALRLGQLLALDLAGFKRIVDNFGVRHTFKKHGQAKIESLRGQIAVVPEDF
jgi:hypothetical protein